jgi:hypothetical protein
VGKDEGASPWIRAATETPGVADVSPGSRLGCSTQVESGRATILENRFDEGDKTRREAFLSIVRPIRGSQSGLVYKNQGLRRVL